MSFINTTKTGKLIFPFLYIIGAIDPILTPRFLFFLLFQISVLLILSFYYNESINYSILNRLFFILLVGYILISGVSILYSINPNEGLFEKNTNVSMDYFKLTKFK